MYVKKEVGMNDKKICFIMCVNNEDYLQEQYRYLRRLTVPEGYETDILTVKDALSMTSGYNEAMYASDAKYKVYLHQDVFIVNKNFIIDMLHIFDDEKIGMFGVVGAPELPENAIMWNGPRVGKLYFNMIYQSGASEIGDIEGEYKEVEAIDGLIMVTQYDIRWNEEIFDKWDFYDVSQSSEFIKEGYKVVVPNQKKPWCIHDDGFFNLKNYYEARRRYVLDYKNV